MAETTETIAEVIPPTSNTLVSSERYLKTGVHIGTKYKSGEMKRYIYKSRKDGLKVLDVQTLDERIRYSAKFIAQIPREKIVVISRKLYGQTAAKKFAEVIGGKAFIGRFVPGTFTNYEGKEFIEPKVVFVTEPEADTQAIAEATVLRIPVIALCSTNNQLKNIDLVIPVNNKGRKSIALVFWFLAREILKERKEIASDEEFKTTIEDFEFLLTGKEEEEEEQSDRPRRMQRDSRDRDSRGSRDSRGGRTSSRGSSRGGQRGGARGGSRGRDSKGNRGRRK